VRQANFSQVSSRIDLLHKITVALTFEKYPRGVRGGAALTDEMHAREISQKISSVRDLLHEITVELTFEKF